ncbi:MAG: Bug family tripartite tricarboxylate transporter substrate binding protein [bacterium]|jgi:tripartite-type tricarboxylate transporter receptor subunit TctC|nr:tripartite tricarboxylate transporter substrate binding protein [Betaproteobacteria bacterium]
MTGRGQGAGAPRRPAAAVLVGRLAVAGLLLGAGAAAAQPAAWPVKPLRIIVPFAAGGPVDAVGRTLGQRLSEGLGQPVLIENRGGAGGSIGMEAMVRAVPDGYTLGVGSLGSLALSPAIDPKLRYDPVKDVTPIASVAVTHYVLVVHPSVPAKSVQDLIRIARERKGRLNYGSSGVGSISHLIAEALQSATPGVEMVHVAYKGIAPALAALLGGEIDLAFLTLPQSEGAVKAGRLRMLAATGAARAEGAKGVPTLIEAGLKLHPVEGSYGLVGPAGLPRELVVRLNGQVIAALKSPDFRQRFESQGFEAVAPNSPEDYAKQIRTDLEVFGRVVKRAGIKPEN